MSLGLLLISLSMGLSQGATLSDEGTVYASLEEDVVIPWTLTLEPGITVTNIAWRKDPNTPIAQLYSGTTFVPDGAYGGRVSAVPDSAASFNLANFMEADVGTYRCTAILDDGGTSVTLVDAQELRIMELARDVTVSASVTEVKEGEDITLTCHSTGGNPPPSYIWIRDGNEIKSTTSNTVVIVIEVGNIGKHVYSCIARNVAGNVPSSNNVEVTISRDDEGVRSLQHKPLSGRKVEVQWTAKSEGSGYKVLYRPLGSDDWTTGPEVLTNDHPNYNHTVEFPQDGSYHVCVLVTNEKGEKKSDIMNITVEDCSAAPESHVRNAPVSPPHGNSTSKNDVVFISEGQSQKVKLDPLEIKPNPAQKKEKKKKKRKKVNKIDASDEDTKPGE
ncbi:cell adhesion molecule CEACAM5-like isoform X2 [Branchiostoma floridae x Branchiostoma belcheri]